MALDGDDDLYEVGADEEPEEDLEEGKGPKFILTEELEDSPNLVPEMMKSEDGKARLKKLVDQAFDDWEEGWESTEEYRQNRADRKKLFAGKLPLKKAPFENAANIHIPQYLENLTRICFRVEGEIFADRRNTFTVEPVGPDDADKAQILSKHGNWQIRYQLPEFRRQVSRAILQFFDDGDVVTHSWWDSARQRNCHETLTADDFVIPYIHLTVMPDLSDVPYKAKKMDMYRHDLQRTGWANVQKVLKRQQTDIDDEPESLMRDELARIDGISKPTGQRSAPYKTIWYEGWTDVFNVEDEDQDRFVQVIFDYHSKTAYKVVIHELPNWQEKLRYEREVSELEMHKSALQEHAAMVEPGGKLEQQKRQFAEKAVDGMEMGLPPPDPVTLDRVEQQLAPPPAPEPPAWVAEQQRQAEEDGVPFDLEMAQPKRPRKEPINTFSHAVCIEPMLGSLGIGFGSIQSDLNRASNILMSQFVDSASLNNVTSYAVAANVEFEGGKYSHAPGAMNKVRGIAPGDLQNAIREMKPGQANPQQMEVIQMLIGLGQSSASAQEVLSGAPGKSGETAKGLNMRIEQANTQLSVPTNNFADNCLGQVLKNNGLLNSIFMPEDEVYNIVNEYGGPEQIQLGRQMYERDYRVMFGADLRFAGRTTRVSEADEVTQMVGGFPQMQANAPFLHAALSSSLRARGADHMIPMLGPAPPPTGQPFNGPTPEQIAAQQAAEAQKAAQQGGKQQAQPPAGPPAA